MNKERGSTQKNKLQTRQQNSNKTYLSHVVYNVVIVYTQSNLKLYSGRLKVKRLLLLPLKLLCFPFRACSFQLYYLLSAQAYQNCPMIVGQLIGIITVSVVKFIRVKSSTMFALIVVFKYACFATLQQINAKYRFKDLTGLTLYRYLDQTNTKIYKVIKC